MKLIALIIGLSFAGSVLADTARLSVTGTTVSFSGNGVTKEIFNIVATAYEKGFKDVDGADFFDQISTPNRVGGLSKYSNSKLETSVRSGITLSYAAAMKAKRKDIRFEGNIVIVTGESAKLLKGAMFYSADPSGPQTVGTSRISSKSGKIVCSRVVYPTAPTTCVMKL